MSIITRFNDDSPSSLLRQFFNKAFQIMIGWSRNTYAILQAEMDKREIECMQKKIKHTFDSCKRSHPLRVQLHGYLSVFYNEIITRMQSCNMSTTWLNVYTVVDPNPVIRSGPIVSPGKNNVQWNPPSIIWSPRYYGHFFWPPGKTIIHFLVKKPSFSTVTYLLQPNFLGHWWPF